MPNIRAIDMMFLDDLFEMGSGYVLNFSNSTFSRFFADELNVDIDDPIYAEQGGSKGKRLRCFLQKVDVSTVTRTLKALWEYREAIRQCEGKPETIENAQGRLLSLINLLEGKPDVQPAGEAPKPAFNRHKLIELRKDLIGLPKLAPQARGYAFERLLGGSI